MRDALNANIGGRPRRAVKLAAAGVLAAAALVAAPTASSAMEPAELVDAELERQAIQFVSLDRGRLRFFDSERRLDTADAARYVSLRFEQVEMAGDASPRLLLTDGHDLPGRLAGVEDDQTLRWEHAELGEVSVSLEDVRAMVLGERRQERPEQEPAEDDVADPAADARPAEPQPETLPAPADEDAVAADLDIDLNPAAVDDQAAEAAEAAEAEPTAPIDPTTLEPAGGDDRVVLRNGDELTGFVAEVGEAALSLQVEGGQTVELAWDRIAAVALANPADPSEGGTWVTLADNTRLNVSDLAMDSDALTGRVLSGRAIELAAEQVAAVAFHERHRLQPLAELEPRVVAGGRVFGVEIVPSFSPDVSRLHAPVTIAVDLPEGAKRFAAEATLEEPGSPAWADLELIVRDEQGERFRERLNGDNPTASVKVAVQGDRLVIELDEAANGAVLDRLELRDAAVLVEH